MRELAEAARDSLVVEGLSAIIVISLDTVHLNALSRTKDSHSVRDPWPQDNRVRYRSSAFSVVNQATLDVVVPRGLELRMGQCPYQLNHHSLHRYYRLFNLHNRPIRPIRCKCLVRGREEHQKMTLWEEALQHSLPK
ncbi:hypothetical protein Dimus_026949, partial [Dionaea muscipula]